MVFSEKRLEMKPCEINARRPAGACVAAWIAVLALVGAGLALAAQADELEQSFREPPPSARVRCWWWWLNSHVDAGAIARDLREMHRMGMGGAAIFDADGSSQDGNRQVPAGPTFASDEWKRLFRFALDEASRYGLEMSLNIMSGWNLGGPHVQPRDSTRRLVWSETVVEGGREIEIALPAPPSREGVCDDVAAVAFPLPAAPRMEVQANGSQEGSSVENLTDGRPETFWVSRGGRPGEGPTPSDPVVLEARIQPAVLVDGCELMGRPNYGPKSGFVQVAIGSTSRTVATFTNAPREGTIRPSWPAVSAEVIRVVITGSWDPKHPDSPRNVQVVEWGLVRAGRPLEWKLGVAGRITRFEEKTYRKYPGQFNAPPAEHLIQPEESVQGESAIALRDVVVFHPHQFANGRLRWNAPPGRWMVLRFASTVAGSRVSTHSAGWGGWAVDHLDPFQVDRYWRQVVDGLLDAAGPHVGRTLAGVQTDSWELGPINWTRAMPQEFARRRGYDLHPWLPAMAGWVVEDRERSNRFLADFRRTLGDLFAEHVRRLAELAHSRGLKLQSETGGPHAAPIDALQTMGLCDYPTGEFWTRNDRHRIGDNFRFFIKQGASAAHLYGHRRVQAESFTSIGPHWERAPRDLKHDLDRAFCEGLNHMMLHTFTCSPESAGLPGQEYFAGTHFNPNVTWWPRADGFFRYVHRCQALLQTGWFVADVLHYYGDHVPNFVRLREDNPAGVWPDYDYDVVNLDALLNRVEARDRRLVLPDGMTYRVLSLPAVPVLSLEALRKVARLVEAGVPVVGPRPVHRSGLSGGDAADREFAELVERMWGAGRISTQSVRKVLADLGVQPDVIVRGGSPGAFIDRIHRRTPDADIYFVANRWRWADVSDTRYYRRFDPWDRYEEVVVSFRVDGKEPEFWDAMTGRICPCPMWQSAGGRTDVPIRFGPEGSIFVVFRHAPTRPHVVEVVHNGRRVLPRESSSVAPAWPEVTVEADESHQVWLEASVPRLYDVIWSHGATSRVQIAHSPIVVPVSGPWTVRFLDGRGAPSEVRWPELLDWTAASDPNIRYYSGRALYEAAWVHDRDPAAGSMRWYVDLGQLHEIGGAQLNGQDLGTVWLPPYRVDVTDQLRGGTNRLVVEVINCWANRLIGDARRPPSERVTRTNITKFERTEVPLRPSGLFGPVVVYGRPRVQVDLP